MPEKSFEIEHRALLSEEQYHQLITFLQSNGQDLGEDDKKVYFFVFSEKLLKVVDNISHNSAKVVLKLNRLGRGSDFEEIEIPIERNQVESFVHFFSADHGTEPLIEPIIKRHNFIYKGVELALKYSGSWKYHAELEVLIDDLSKKDSAENQIAEVAQELGIQIMSLEELSVFTAKVEAEYKAKVR